MKKDTIKILKDAVKGIRFSLITALKDIAKQHGDENGYLEFAELKGQPSFVQSNTEDVIYGFDSKGKIVGENDQDESLEILSTDLLILILETLNKKLKLG